MHDLNLRRRLRFENLEQKRVLATTAVALMNGDLVITGDNEGNDIIVARDDEAAPFPIMKIIANESQTLVSQIAGVPVITTDQGFDIISIPLELITRDVIINSGLGDDRLRIFGDLSQDDIIMTSVPRDLVINAGGGNDFVSFGLYDNHFELFAPYVPSPINVGRNLIFNGGQGDDQVYLSGGSIIGNDVTITDTQGSNIIDFYSVDLMDGVMNVANFTTHIHGDLAITTGNGADTVTLEDFHVDGNVDVNVAGGDDVVTVLFGYSDDLMSAVRTQFGGNFTVALGSGVNSSLLTAIDVAGGMAVGGSGTNTIEIYDTNVGSVFAVLTNNGNDVVTAQNVNAAAGLFSTAGGSDYLAIIESAFALLTVDLGAGNDTMELLDVDAILAILSGGSGTDTYNDYGDNDLLLELALGFELNEDFSV